MASSAEDAGVLATPKPIRLGNPLKYDAIVIGTGQAGPSLAVRLAAEGMKTAVIERKFFGGTCVNTGCIPTKAMVASARVAHFARRSADYGVNIEGDITVDMKLVKARKDAMVVRSQQGVRNRLEKAENCRVYQGHAVFEGPHLVRVGQEQLTADRIFVNVGARAVIPNVPGLDRISYYTNSSMMQVDFLPEHLIILGGNYVGLEFAQMYRRFGSKVTVIEKESRLLARDDEDISQAIWEILEEEGISFLLNTELTAVSKTQAGIGLTVQCGTVTRQINGSHFLLAVGRRPNTDDLGLELAGVKTDKKGYIQVDDELRTNVPGVWALGDCNGKGAFTHTSYNDFEIVAANLFDSHPRRLSDRITAYALYIDPPLGRAGLTETGARQLGRQILIGKMPMTRVSRAMEKGETQGFMKILVDAETELILGAAVLGVEGDEVIHTILDMMYAKAPYTVIRRAMHIHPTVSELIPTMLGELKPPE
ncbi:MAG: FAD-containing oxidoreductase [Acidobacteria bacterium]|nr:FAD-containing oxidoreductase [Acidobacteriota bacterium]